MRSKYIFFDVDGTIWDENMDIPQSTIDAIRLLKENGHKTFICSGRSRSNINSKKLLDLGFSGILAACGNHIEIDGEVIYEYLLEDELVKRIVNTCEKNHMPVVLEGPKYHWISEEGFEEDPFIDYLWASLQDAARPMRGYEKDICINKFSADIIEGTNFEAIKEELQDDLDILMHTESIVEFVPKGTSKATGIDWLCKKFGIDIADTYAVGDSVNDLDMLAFAGHGIAMGNASDKPKEIAEYITTDIHEDGIYNAMVHYGLIK